MKYEFRGKTLNDVVRKATSASLCYKDDAGEQNSCRQLARWIDRLESEADDMKRDIDFLKARTKDLTQSRNENLANTAISAAIAASGALASAARSAVILRRILNGGSLRWDDAFAAVSIIGAGIQAARSSLAALRDHREAREILRDLDRLKQVQSAMEGTLRELNAEWAENRCDRFYS